jgi:hypothetical protein
MPVFERSTILYFADLRNWVRKSLPTKLKKGEQIGTFPEGPLI